METVGPKKKEKRIKKLRSLLNYDERLVKKYFEKLVDVDPESASKYLVNYDIIKEIQEEEQRKKSSSTRILKGGLKDPLYEKKLKCYFHDSDWFKGYLLKERHQVIEEDEFLVKNYIKAKDGYASCNYLTLEVHTCPECLYSSNKLTDFIYIKRRGARETIYNEKEISDKLKDEMLNSRNMKYRREIVKDAGKKFFSRKRTPREGILSFLLANHCASIEVGCGNISSTYSIAENFLKLARLYLEMKQKIERRDCLSKALDAYKIIYDKDILPAKLKQKLFIFRQIVALAVEIGDGHSAKVYRNILFNERMKLKKSIRLKEQSLWEAKQQNRIVDIARINKQVKGFKDDLRIYEGYWKTIDSIWQSRDPEKIP